MMEWLRRRRENLLDEEIAAHLRMAAQDRIERGETPEAARRAARREFGNEGLVKEVTRQMWGWVSLDRLWRDFRFAARMLRRNPGFTAVVTLTLALGIGANTALFSVMQAVLQPVPVAHPERVMMVWTDNAARGWRQFPASVPDYHDWQASGAFSSLSGFVDTGFNVRFQDRTDRISGLSVTREFFGVMSAEAQLGRVFRAEDVEPGHDQVAILSDGLWRSRFGADPGIIGRTLVVDGTPRTVIGVLARSFPKLGKEEMFCPLVFATAEATERGRRYFGVIGRLQPGLGLAAAQQRLTDLSRRLARQYPEDSGNSARIQPVEEAFSEDSRGLLSILFGAVGFVLLIACANIAGLQLARGTARVREMTIRAALGASRWRLSRQLLAESVVLALMGGALAIIPAAWGIHFITSFQLDELPDAALIRMDWSVLVFNFALALGTGLLFGLLPAWQVRRVDANTALKSSSRSYTGGQGLRGVLVAGEVALTLVLLAGAGLMLRSFLGLRSAWPGYDPHGALTMKIAISGRQYAEPARQAGFVDELLRRAGRLPGVRAAGLIDGLPGDDSFRGSGIYFPDRPQPRPEDVPIVLNNAVTPGYFRAMRIPLVRGREFDERDRAGSKLVAVVDQWTARRYWPGEDAIGKQFRLHDTGPLREVVGVAGSVDQPMLAKAMGGQTGQVYVPYAQEPQPVVSVVIRAEGDAAALTSAMRNLVRRLDVDQPIFQVRTLEEVHATGRTSQRLGASLLGSFAAMALLLASVGLYGVMAYGVGRRTREFGIRISLGAPPRGVLAQVMWQGILLTGCGIVVGVAGAVALTRFMRTLLYGVGPTDAVTLAGVTALLALVAVLASYLPARRATRIDPVMALREE